MTNLASALLEAQKAMPAIHKDSKVDTGKFKYTYLSLPALLEVVLPVLNNVGLAFTQMPSLRDDGQQVLTTTLFYAGTEETLIGETPLVLNGPQTPQLWGGAVTYARRYALTSLLGIAADEDDDGQAASRPKVSQNKKPSVTQAMLESAEDIDFPAPKIEDKKPKAAVLAEIRKLAADLLADKSTEAKSLQAELAKLSWRDDWFEADLALAKLHNFFAVAA